MCPQCLPSISLLKLFYCDTKLKFRGLRDIDPWLCQCTNNRSRPVNFFFFFLKGRFKLEIKSHRAVFSTCACVWNLRWKRQTAALSHNQSLEGMGLDTLLSEEMLDHTCHHLGLFHNTIPQWVRLIGKLLHSTLSSSWFPSTWSISGFSFYSEDMSWEFDGWTKPQIVFKHIHYTFSPCVLMQSLI